MGNSRKSRPLTPVESRRTTQIAHNHFGRLSVISTLLPRTSSGTRRARHSRPLRTVSRTLYDGGKAIFPVTRPVPASSNCFEHAGLLWNLATYLLNSPPRSPLRIPRLRVAGTQRPLVLAASGGGGGGIHPPARRAAARALCSSRRAGILITRRKSAFSSPRAGASAASPNAPIHVLVRQSVPESFLSALFAIALNARSFL